MRLSRGKQNMRLSRGKAKNMRLSGGKQNMRLSRGKAKYPFLTTGEGDFFIQKNKNHCYPFIEACLRHVRVISVGRVYIQPSLYPLHVEVGREGDTVILIIYFQYFLNIYSYRYIVGLLNTEHIITTHLHTIVIGNIDTMKTTFYFNS